MSKGGNPQRRRRHSRRTRVLTRTVPLVIVAAAAAVLGWHLAGASRRAQRAQVLAYAQAWSRDQYGAMWDLLTPASQREFGRSTFAAQLSGASRTATVSTMTPLAILSIRHGLARVSFVVRTRTFGTLHEVAQIRLSGSGGGTRVVFDNSLLFPGLRPGELLSRSSSLGRRGTLLASDGTVLANGSSLSSPIPQVAEAIAGSLGPIPASETALYGRLGYPSNAQVGIDGLEQDFQRRLAGRLGGRLLAGRRVLATAVPGDGATVRTTIDPRLEQDAIAALGDDYAGITVLNARTGAIEAAAGIALTALQPPGSTFKIVTASAALQAKITTPETVYPYASSTEIDGFTMENAGGESCGGTLTDAFANSCDTTFAPLGAQLGATKLVAMARAFGFDRPVIGIPSALESTIPSASAIGGQVAVAASAIGQGLVQASTLEVADMAAAIADGGRRPLPTLTYGAKPRYVRVTTPRIAAEVQSMMEAVVDYGTGTSAQIPGVKVAGKTGTAELRDTAGKQNEAKDTDAWFVGYAPVGHPKVVVCALFPNQGYGGDTAAPAVKQVLEEALGVS